MAKRLIPFGWLPGHWGLVGKTRERAQAEYDLEGKELDLKLAEIDYYDDSDRYTLATLKIALKYKDIQEWEYRKGIATLNEEAWFEFIGGTIDRDMDGNEFFNLDYDWNEIFIAEKRELGFDGNSDDEVVDNWLFMVFMFMMNNYNGANEDDESYTFITEMNTTRSRDIGGNKKIYS